MNAIPISLPPLAEQHRIVAKVDEINSEWTEMTSVMRAKIIPISKQVAAAGCGITEYVEMESLVIVNNALTEFSTSQ